MDISGVSSRWTIVAGRTKKTVSLARRGAASATRGGAAAVVVLLSACGGGSDGVATADAGAQSASGDRKRPLAATVATAPFATDGWVTLPNVADPLLENLSIPADAPRRGMWSRSVAWPLNAIHAAQLSDGRVLTFGTPFNNAAAQDGRYYDIWSPSLGVGPASHVRSEQPDPVNSFCAAATWLPDGRLLVAGGNGAGGKSSGLFSTALTTTVADGARLAAERWYATMITLADGRPLIMGGSIPYGPPTAPTPEVYEAGSWRSLLGASSTPTFGARRLGSTEEANTWYYPRAWVAPDGSVFGVTSSIMFRLRPDANNRSGSIEQIGTFKTPQDATGATTPNVGFTSTAVMFDTGRILQVGGNGISDNNPNLASQQATVIDINGPTPALSETNPMSFRRHWANATVLPGGQVAVTGGSTIGWDPSNAVRAVEIWDPATGQWTLGASHVENRTYHSSALLLTNGTVLTAGGGAPGTVNNLNAELYYPPQLFATVNGQAQLARRPVLAAISRLKHLHGDTLGLRLAEGTALSQVTLVALGSVTHGFNPSQRRVPLSFSQTDTAVTAQLPSANLAPPGYYMVFAIDRAGVPSRGTIIALGELPAPSIQGVSAVPASAQVCAQEGGTCRLPAGVSASVYYGAGNSFVVKTGLRDAVACTNASFGDPANGRGKSCAYVTEAPSVVLPPLEAPAVAAGIAARFTAPASPGSSYSWSFGDGSPVTGFSPGASASHVYAQPGVYTVTVTVRSSAGAISSRSVLQAVNRAPTASQPTASSGAALEPRGASSARLWVVNADANSVAVIDTATNARVAEIAVGRQPVSVAVAGNGRLWVVNKADASISIINPGSLAVERTVPLRPGSQPHGLAFAPGGGPAFVALEGSGQLLRLDAASAAQTAALTLPGAIRHVSVRGDGSQVLVTRFITAPLPGEDTARIDTARGGAEVHVVQASPMTLARTVLLRHSDKIDNELQGAGIPNYLGAAVIAPDGRSAWVPSKQDNIRRGVLRNGRNLDFQNTVRAISSRIDLAALAEDLPRRVDHDNSSVGSAAAFHPSGVYLFVALETSRQVAVVDAYGGRELFKVDVGRAPQALAVSADGRTLYVQNYMDRSVSVLDLSPLAIQGRSELPLRATIGTVGKEPLAAQVLVGKQLFYDARDPRLARDSYMSCASCHNEGGQDGRVWDLTGFGEGLRNTVALKGRAGTGQGLLHWSGNFDEVQDFEGQIRALAGGTGLMSDASLLVGTRNLPLGDKKAGVSADMDALAAYVATLGTADASPWRNTDGSLSAAAVAGKAVFENSGCASCHGGSSFSGSSLQGGMRSVGTLKASSGRRLNGPLAGLDAPGLRSVWATAPYLHDGSAPTLGAAVAAHAGNPVGVADMPNLVAYLMSLDGSDPAPPPSLPDGVYRLVAVHSGQTLNIVGIDTADGAAAIQWPWLGGDNERWLLRRQPDGSVTFAARHSGKLLEVAGCSQADGARVQQWPANGAPCQRWRLQPQSDGSLTIANVASGKLLNVRGESLARGTEVLQWPASNKLNERWRLEPVSANGVAAGYYGLVNLNSGKALDVAGISAQAGANVHQWTWLNGANQQWNVIPTADGYFELAPAHAPRMRLEVAAGGLGNGGNVQQGLANGSAAQRWAFEREPDGIWRLINLNSGRSLDVSAGSMADGGNVHQWDWIGVSNQRWRLQASTTALSPVITEGRSVSFEALNWPGYRIRHTGFVGVLSAVSSASPALARLDSSFIARAGLGDDGCWSFESVNYPGHYLRRDSASRLALSQRVSDAAFGIEATFCVRPPRRADGGASLLSLESLAVPGRFVRHRNFEVWLDADDGTELYRSDSSLRVQPALAP